MSVLGLIGGVVSGIGSVVSTIMGFKRDQADIIQSALGTLGDVSASDASREQAVAQIISSEMMSGSWMAINWRPILMFVCMGIVISYWWGYVPPHFNGPMSPMMEELFGLIKIGMGGYIASRGLEKIINSLSLSSVLRKFIEKKLV